MKRLHSFFFWLTAYGLLLTGHVSGQGFTGNYDELYRPQFHFSPPAHWMNDPNGLVFHKGKFHLFYQYHPHSTVWGPMHWGHAVSTDLIRWKHLPIALSPDKKGHIFSGSVVIDKDNTAGFGHDAMVAIFTYHNDEIWKKGRKNTESQALAYSTDEGKTWKKFKGNPVLNNTGEQDFRDPKVFWSDKTKRWTMVLAVQDRVRIFSSPNLKDWRFESDFQPKEEAVLGVWECPDLFPMKFGPEEKWVMMVSHGNNVRHGSGTRYFVGDFDGKAFYAETPGRWIDYGPDYYAAVTFANTADRKFLLGWMSHWDYAQQTPTGSWRGAMALPRELKLERDDSGWFLRQFLIKGLEPVEKPRLFFLALPLPYQNEYLRPQSLVKINMASPSSEFAIKLSNKLGDEFNIVLKNREMYIDRSKSGKVDFEERFVETPRKMPVPEPITDIRILIDRSSLEILANDGKYVMTSQCFPLQDYSVFRMEGDVQLEEWFIYDIGSIWKN